MTSSAIPAVPSATVMILRDGEAGLEVLLGRRRRGRAFGEAHVFPGGVIDADDRTGLACCEGLGESEAAVRLGIPDALGYWVAAVREVFEETGLAFIDMDGRQAGQLPVLRRALLSGDTSFLRMCQDHELRLQLGGIHYVAHWITPLVRPVRFDTRFFVAAVPPGQRADHDGVELTDSVWLTPGRALAQQAARELKLARPTLVQLQRLSRFSSVAGALAWAADRWRAGVPTILPTVKLADDPGQFATISGATADGAGGESSHD
jgi:8-oxo-dGTP pyrophosphatase MutT (NUDIX family)